VSSYAFNEIICLFHRILIDGLTALASNVPIHLSRANVRAFAASVRCLHASQRTEGDAIPSPFHHQARDTGYRGKGMM
jgi:hypothetical protein